MAVSQKLVLADPHARLTGGELWISLVGPVLYLAGHNLFRLRMAGNLSRRRLLVSALLLSPVATWATVEMVLLPRLTKKLSAAPVAEGEAEPAKEHGEGGLLVGFDYATWTGEGPCRVVLIEDVTTAGTSVRESLPLIHAAGKASAIGLVVSVDRMEKGAGDRPALREIREDFGLKTTAIVSVLDLIEFLR